MSELSKALPESCREHLKSMNDGHIFQYTKITEWKGRRFEPVFPARTIEHAYKNHQPLDNDVLVLSFKKTGTNWSREIVRQILYGRDPKLDRITRDISFPIVYLETGEPSKYEVIHNLPLPRRYHITHLPYELVNFQRYKEKNMKFIFMLRNPKDQMVSFFHHMQNIPIQGDLEPYAGKSWDDFFQMEIEGSFPHCLKEGENYLDYLLSWWPHVKDDKNTLIVVYEEMIKDPVGHVKKIAAFLDVEISDDIANSIATGSSLEKMQSSAATLESEEDVFRTRLGMLRKGEVGNWKEYFTVAQSELLDKITGEKLAGTGIKFIYE